jgi:sulfonate transport system ATP-binding protein
MVSPGSLLGNASFKDRRSNSGDGLDSPGDGPFPIGRLFRSCADCASSLVSSDDADRVRSFQHPNLLPRCGPDARSRPNLSHIQGGHPSSDAEHLHRPLHGARSVVFDPRSSRNSGREIGSRLVPKLGSGLGGVWKSVCRVNHHGSLLLDHHDGSVYCPRPRTGLAKRGHQVVAIPVGGVVSEGSSLRVQEVTKEFPPNDRTTVRTLALDRITFSVGAAELVSIVGPSGCGKSTLLRLIAGLDFPSSGELRVGAEAITGPSAERGLVFQDPNLFPWLTVRRNIQAGLEALGLLRHKRHEVNEFIHFVGLEGFADVYPHHLSGGMAQRVALARTLITHPRVLLLDEPLGALDAFTRMRMQDEVMRLWQSRLTTTLLVTHDIDEAIYMSDRILIMTPRPGRIERMIPVDLARPRDRSSSKFLELRSEILQLLHFAGNAPEENRG